MLNSGVVALLESATEMRGTELVGYEGEPGWASVLAVEGKSEPEERGQREEREETNNGFRADHEEGSLVEVVNLSLYPADPSRGCHCGCLVEEARRRRKQLVSLSHPTLTRITMVRLSYTLHSSLAASTIPIPF
jgi:hypothetical protein